MISEMRVVICCVNEINICDIFIEMGILHNSPAPFPRSIRTLIVLQLLNKSNLTFRRPVLGCLLLLLSEEQWCAPKFSFPTVLSDHAITLCPVSFLQLRSEGAGRGKCPRAPSNYGHKVVKFCNK